MFNAYKNFWKGYVNFTGRSTRSEYWWIYFTNLLICLPAYTKYHAVVSTRPYNLEALRSLQAMSGFYFFLLLFSGYSHVAFYRRDCSSLTRRWFPLGLYLHCFGSSRWTDCSYCDACLAK